MRIESFRAEADLVGRRIRLAWRFAFDAGETLAHEPAVRVRRKRRDHSFPAPPIGSPDPFAVYDSQAFPPPGALATELPIEDRRDGERRTLRVETSVTRDVDGAPVEVLRRIETTHFDGLDRPLERELALIDLGDGIGGLTPNVPYYYALESPALAGGPLRAGARAGERYGLDARMYRMLPAIHRQHDNVPVDATVAAAPWLAESPARAGQLQRFLAPFGNALDLMRSTAEGVRDLHDVDEVDARLLPMLARWIGWEPSLEAEIPARRHEIKYAPALYRVTGTIPSALIWTQHALQWGARVKEYVHNVFRSNDAPQLNLWLRVRDGGAWSEPRAPQVLDAAHSGRPMAATAPDGRTWIAYHTQRMNRWGIWLLSFRADEGWSAAEPLSSGRTIDSDPALAALPDGSLLLFWTAYDAARERYGLHWRRRDAAGAWSATEVFGAATDERRRPSATVDASGAVWLFWMERASGRWRLRYARFDGAWSAPIDFPRDGGDEVRVEGRPFACAFDAPGRRLWIFFAQEVATGTASQSRCTLVFRTKASLAADDAGWGSVEELSVRPPSFHDDDPAAFVGPDGALELFYASSRTDGWSLWRRRFEAASDVWGAEEMLPSTPYSEREPCPFAADGRSFVLHRSDRSPVYESARPGGIRSVDFRYAGSTTPRVEHALALALHRRFEDFARYTYDLGGERRTDDDRTADDTLGLFLDPNTLDAAEVAAGVGKLRQVLARCLPATERAVLVTEPLATGDPFPIP